MKNDDNDVERMEGGAGWRRSPVTAASTLVALAMLLAFTVIVLWRGLLSPESTVAMCVVLATTAARVTSRRRRPAGGSPPSQGGGLPR